MKKIAVVIAAFACAVACEAWAEQPAGETAALTNSDLDELLPGKGRSRVCYAGSFTKQAIEIEDWSSTKQVPVPGLFRFGEQVMRPEPAKLPDQEISSITLLLTDQNYAANFGWIYDFTLRATPEQLGETLFAAGNCPWYPIGAVDWKEEIVKSHGAVLGCGIECDGGTMTVERVAGTDELLLRFDGETAGLRMSAGCGGGGSYRVGTADRDGETAFRLKKVKRSECRPLERWRKSQ